MFETLISYDLVPFIFALSVLVFIHEWGHFIVARMNGVAVDVFSIGFGPELFGWNSKKTGMRWKFAAIPLGGYVKMRGDTNAASIKTKDANVGLDVGEDVISEEEKSVSFPHQSLGARAAIVAAGPAANFLFAIIVMSILFVIVGKPFVEPKIDLIAPDSAAQTAGFAVGDKIVTIDGKKVSAFRDIKRFVTYNTGEEMQFVVERDGRTLTLPVTPKIEEIENNFGGVTKIPLVGIGAQNEVIQKLSVPQAVKAAGVETVQIVEDIFTALKQIIMGTRSFKELGGPVKIAQISGEVAEHAGLVSFIMLMVMLSVNLGLVNLFPIPALDGGHLLYYAYEAVFRKPMSERVQEVGAAIGVGLLLTFIAVVTWNDVMALITS